MSRAASLAACERAGVPTQRVACESLAHGQAHAAGALVQATRPLPLRRLQADPPVPRPLMCLVERAAARHDPRPLHLSVTFCARPLPD